mgnify:CR=1 FL=1
MNHTSYIGHRAQDWCINRHAITNHYYDEYLPYAFHLRMVVQAFHDFKHLLPKDFITEEVEAYKNHWVTEDKTLSTIEKACWGHDLIEDTRTSYNDVEKELGENAAKIIYAVTNEKGKNRKERANDKYYEGIRNQPGAIFVKLCDRIANLQYSKLTKSRQFEMYKKENPNFIHQLGYGKEETKYLQPMFDYLNNLTEDVA